MKVIHIYGKIVNCGEIRDVEIAATKYIHIHYKNPSSPNDRTIIECQNRADAIQVMDIIYNEMIS